MYTIIPDLHADYDRLEKSLKLVSSDEVIFLGDLIDAGYATNTPNDLKVLKQVRNLMENDGARCILGNHELNAILFHRLSTGTGKPLRAHDPSKIRQHQSFINTFGVATPEALQWTTWMLNKMPLWIDLPGLRLVHAQWDTRAIKEISKRRPTGYLKAEDLEEIADKKSAFAKAVETLTTGAEVTLPNKATFKDKNGTSRSKVRLAWWKPQGCTWQEMALSIEDTSMLPAEPFPESIMKNFTYSDSNPPVLVGHYKMTGDLAVHSPNATSLDYPKNACIYKWKGEDKLLSSQLISIN